MISVDKALENYDKYSDFDEQRGKLINLMTQIKKDRWKYLRDICTSNFNMVKTELPFVDIDFDTCLKLFNSVKVTAAIAKREPRMEKDNNYLFKRFLGGVFGEYAVCDYFKLDKRKLIGSPGGSYTNDFADLLPWGYKIGVKNSKVGNSIKINKFYLYDQIICQYEILNNNPYQMKTKEDEKLEKKYGMHRGQKVRVYICGVLTENLQNFFCHKELVDTDDLYKKDSKVGFIDFKFLDKTILYSNALSLKYKTNIQIENILFSYSRNPKEFIDFLSSKSNFVYVELNDLKELVLYKYRYNEKYRNVNDSDKIDINKLFICEEKKQIDFICYKPYRFNLSKSDFRVYQEKIKEVLLFCSKNLVIGYGVRGVLHTFQSIYSGGLKGSLYYLDLSMVVNNELLCEQMSYNFIDKEKDVWGKFLNVYKDISAFNYVHKINDAGILSYHRIFEWLFMKSDDRVRLKDNYKNYIHFF